MKNEEEAESSAAAAAGELQMKVTSRTSSGSSDDDYFEENENANTRAMKEAEKAAKAVGDVSLPTDSVFVSRMGGGMGTTAAAGSGSSSDAAGGTTVPNGENLHCHARTYKRWCEFYNANSFLVLVLCVILLAYAYPPLGATYLAPHITATWIAVVFIFILAGLGLKTAEFSKALQRLHFNALVHVFNFGVVSAIVFGFSRFLVAVGALAHSLADGMVICACLPLTVNMVLVLTKSSGGDEASAVFNAAFGNMVGVFLSPALIMAYLGVQGEVNLGTVFLKLGLRVVLPIGIGQVLQKFSPPTVAFVKKYKKYFKTTQEYCLVFIVYTVFCKTFLNGSDAGPGDIFIMIALQFCLLCGLMGLAWLVLGVTFRKEPTLRVMGLFGCTHKTVAMGVPLINAIYEANPLVGLYTLPLLIWHPMQLVLGSFLAPKLAAWVEREQTRLGKNELVGGGDAAEREEEGGGDAEKGEASAAENATEKRTEEP